MESLCVAFDRVEEIVAIEREEVRCELLLEVESEFVGKRVRVGDLVCGSDFDSDGVMLVVEVVDSEDDCVSVGDCEAVAVKLKVLEDVGGGETVEDSDSEVEGVGGGEIVPDAVEVIDKLGVDEYERELELLNEGVSAGVIVALCVALNSQMYPIHQASIIVSSHLPLL